MLVVTRAQRIERPNVRESVHCTVEGLDGLGLLTREDVGLRELLIAVGLKTVPGRPGDRTVLDESDYFVVRSKTDRRFVVGFCLDEPVECAFHLAAVVEALGGLRIKGDGAVHRFNCTLRL